MKRAALAAILSTLALLALPGAAAREPLNHELTPWPLADCCLAHFSAPEVAVEQPPSAEDGHPFTEVNSGQAPVDDQIEEEEEETTDTATEDVLSLPELMMFSMINAEREQLGLTSLQIDGPLTDLARFRSQDMADQDYFSHVAPDGASARSLMIARGIGPGLMGEILGRNNSSDLENSVTSVVEAFLKSPSHHSTMLNPRFTWAGVGTSEAPGNMKYYTVLFFGP